MRVSVRLPEPIAGRDVGLEALVEVAQAVEQRGFDACWVTDHPMPVVEPGSPGHHAWDPFTALAAVAATTSRLLLHTNLVVLPYRNPFIVAKAAATLDVLSGGRLILGLGAGYMEPEFAALGADLADREELMREGVEALAAAWSGKPVTLASSRWRVDGNAMLPRPVQTPRPPLWRGGNSRAAIRHAIAACDGWTPFEVTSEWAGQTRTPAVDGLAALADRIRLMRELAAEAGRTPPLDVCLVRARADWLDRPLPQVREELAALEELGVNWLAVALRGSMQEQLGPGLDRLAEAVR